MSKPRPPNMFQSPQESIQAPMRDKLLFTEAMMTAGELSGREQRVAFLLTSLWTHTRGCATRPCSGSRTRSTSTSAMSERS
jgi:hypothetical protein